jgi:hypothetical protein
MLARRIFAIWLAGLLLANAVIASANPDGAFVDDIILPDGKVVVVAEARLEPRSIGSYSIRLYSGTDPEYPYDDFLTGVVVPRDGTVERIGLADIDGDGVAELVVVTRSVGSGSYGSARAFSVTAEDITQVVQVEGIAPDRDPVEQLKD